MTDDGQPGLPADWILHLQDGRLASDDPRIRAELSRLADAMDPADGLAVFANVDVPEIDEPQPPIGA